MVLDFDYDLFVLYLEFKRLDDLLDASLNFVTSLPCALDQSVFLSELLPTDHRTYRELKNLS